mgnify:CR=1 FL=1
MLIKQLSKFFRAIFGIHSWLVRLGLIDDIALDDIGWGYSNDIHEDDSDDEWDYSGEDGDGDWVGETLGELFDVDLGEVGGCGEGGGDEEDAD